MAHPLHRGGDGLPVDDAPRPEGDLQAEPLPGQPPQDLQLDLTHELDVDLPELLVPHQPQLRVLLLQLPQLGHGGVRILAPGQQHLTGEDRLQNGLLSRRLKAQALAGPGPAQAGDGAHRPRLGPLCRLELLPRVDADLVHLLLPGAGSAGEEVLHLQNSAGDLQVGQPVPLAVPGDLEHPCAEVLRSRRLAGVAVQTVQQPVHPLQLQCRAEAAGEELPLRHQPSQALVGQGAALQKGLHGLLAAHGGLLQPVVDRPVPHIHTAVVQLGLQLRHQSGPVGAGQVHLVHKEEDRHAVAFQQPPQGHGVALNAVGAADDQDGIVQHPHGPLRLAGEVHVARGVQQGDDGLP